MSPSKKDNSDSNSGKADKLSSDELSAIIIDALLQAEIIKENDVQKSIKIATEEIDVRKVLGDY